MFDIMDRIGCIFHGHVWNTIYPTKNDGIELVNHYFGGGTIKLRCVGCGKVKETRIKP